MVRAKWAALGIAVIVAASGTGMMAASSIGLFDDPVEQPIAFPHNLHAGAPNSIPCMYCHNSADRSVDAGIPAVQVCAGCHAPVGSALFRGDSTGIQQLVAYWREQRPIPWVRVYDLPDHVHFPHMRHVNAGVQCQECHGPVETMPVIELNQPLTMGWCLECHNAREVRTDCAVCHY
ncbi:MAG: cytochrome c3 family protein [Longimicrobiales bacterium]